MEEKALVRILLSITMMLASWPVDAHQPVLNSESRTFYAVPPNTN